MRSASASAAFTIDSACSRWTCADWGRAGRAGTTAAGSGGSCWKEKSLAGLPFVVPAGAVSSVVGMPGPGAANGRPLYELLIGVVLRAPDRERTGFLELADDGD